MTGSCPVSNHHHPQRKLITMKNRTVTPALSLAAALVLSLGACGLQGGAVTDSPTTGSNRPTTATETANETATETATAEPAPETGLTGTDPGILALGKTFTYSDGLQVTLSKPTAMTSSEYASPGSVQGLSFDVTIVNGTTAKFDPSLGYLTAQIGNAEAEQIFDTENGYEGGPSTAVLPGREVAYKVAFEGTDTSSLVVEFAPDWERGSLVFTPNGK